MPSPRLWKLLALVQIPFGGFLALGSSGEVVVVLFPEVLPPEALAELALLHAPPHVRDWVLVQNLMVLPVALGFLTSGFGLWWHSAWASRWTRRCAAAMLALALSNQLILAILLYPALRAGTVGVGEPELWLGMLIFAGVAVMVWPAIVWVVLASHDRRA